MVRLLFPFLIQNRGSFELLGVVLVVEVDRPIEGERVKDRRFGILRMVLMQPLHCLLVKRGTGLVVDLVVILVKDLDRSEVFGLARRLGVRGLALLDRLPAGFEVGRRKRRDERIG